MICKQCAMVLLVMLPKWRTPSGIYEPSRECVTKCSFSLQKPLYVSIFTIFKNSDMDRSSQLQSSCSPDKALVRTSKVSPVVLSRRSLLGALLDFAR